MVQNPLRVELVGRVLTRARGYPQTASGAREMVLNGVGNGLQYFWLSQYIRVRGNQRFWVFSGCEDSPTT